MTTIKDKVIKERKKNETEDKIEKVKMNGCEISKEYVGIVTKDKEKMIEKSKILKKEINEYIDKNVKFYEDLTKKITEALTYDDSYEFYFNSEDYKKLIEKEKHYSWGITEWVSAGSQMGCSKLSINDYIYEVIRATERSYREIDKFTKKEKFGGRCKYSFGYRNSLPYGEDYHTSIKFTHKYYKVDYTQYHSDGPDYVRNDDDCEIKFDKDKLIKYLNKEGLTVEDLGKGKLRVKLNEDK